MNGFKNLYDAIASAMALSSFAPKRLVGLAAGLPTRDPNVLKLPVAHRRKLLPVTRAPPPYTDQGDPAAHLLCHAHDLCPSSGLSTRRRVELAFSWSQRMSKRQRDVSAKTEVSSSDLSLEKLGTSSLHERAIDPWRR